MKQKISNAARINNSAICCGLDGPPDDANSHLVHNMWMVDETKDIVAAYKINPSFYDPFKAYNVIRETIRYIRMETNDIVPVILDEKYGDVKHTTYAQREIAFDIYNADAVTAHDYSGSFELFYEEDPTKGVFLTTWSSESPGSYHSDPLWKRNDGDHENLGFVCGWEYGVKSLRGWFPRSAILVPGIGAQGVDINVVGKYFNKENDAPCIGSVSRSIQQNPRAEINRLNNEIGFGF